MFYVYFLHCHFDEHFNIVISTNAVRRNLIPPAKISHPFGIRNDSDNIVFLTNTFCIVISTNAVRRNLNTQGRKISHPYGASK